ncbi:hypothetical protein SAMN02745121_09064 [Nannocystis exedens]|uniref:Uncharacterized protein n=1 Tax=Nannocystis exedens TaxID=54 RepID=A0A1I2IWR1_9BACT|nr:hypothetical protein NAEX_01192 [Nannocystis exedens]SFF46922.1 hypothetical protein SAMN02745121_09064 [Nannocystis exedens]
MDPKRPDVQGVRDEDRRQPAYASGLAVEATTADRRRCTGEDRLAGRWSRRRDGRSRGRAGERDRCHRGRARRCAGASPRRGRRRVARASAGRGRRSSMIPSNVRVFVCPEPQDMRRGFDRLALTVRAEMGRRSAERCVLRLRQPARRSAQALVVGPERLRAAVQAAASRDDAGAEGHRRIAASDRDRPAQPRRAAARRPTNNGAKTLLTRTRRSVQRARDRGRATPRRAPRAARGACECDFGPGAVPGALHVAPGALPAARARHRRRTEGGA